MLLTLALSIASARDVTIAVISDSREPVPHATITTLCGCRAETTPDGEWTGDAMPGPNGAIALVPGAVVDVVVSAGGYETTTTQLKVRPGRSRYTIHLDEIVYDFELDHGFSHCGFMDDYAPPPPDDTTSAFRPEPPPPPPTVPGGWECQTPPPATPVTP